MRRTGNGRMGHININQNARGATRAVELKIKKHTNKNTERKSI